ncbi:general stress protein [Cellulomonas rhizosphaerae]|uniref:general stress protein n=1 Tax=Cellulomonas rhizosphaerae TaxID=2293719 RepID=UPI001F40F359|nr:general stress protein [Cellulomonas rhizosphaerae]
MSFNRPARIPRTPTLPQGETVATYGTYLEAQRAVEVLAEKQFPVPLLTIVGADLRMVERVTGKLSYPRVASGGFATGAWFGLFVGLVLSLFASGDGPNPFLPSIVIGGAFGLLFSVLMYAFTRGRRDFTSQSQIVASSYAVLCASEKAHQARHLLQEVGGVASGWPTTPPVVPTQPAPDLRPAPEGGVPGQGGAPGPEAPGGHETPTQPPAPPQS